MSSGVLPASATVYLVGGAVRDALLGIQGSDRDYVVVGANPEQMLAAGFVPVGKDFPVFIHPRDGCEYALARTERKLALGYHGFSFFNDPSVTLEEDLLRRDLTINAIAQNANGEIFDPYNGQVDLKNRVLRHVSEAFAEDPVRILRIARFAARLPEFTIAPETQALMRSMVERGEVDALIAERVWKEVGRGLLQPQPSKLFAVLNDCNALDRLLPELNMQALVLDTLDQTQALQSLELQYAVLSFGFSLSSISAEEAVKTVNQRWRIPNDCADLALLAVREHSAIISKVTQNSASEIVRLFERADSFRKPQRFEDVLTVCEAYSRVPKQWLMHALQVANQVNAGQIARAVQEANAHAPSNHVVINAINKPTIPAQIKQQVHDARVEAVRKVLATQK